MKPITITQADPRYSYLHDCSECDGTGEQRSSEESDEGLSTFRDPCAACGGTGETRCRVEDCCAKVELLVRSGTREHVCCGRSECLSAVIEAERAEQESDDGRRRADEAARIVQQRLQAQEEKIGC